MNAEFHAPPGVYLQLYRGAMRGKREELLRYLDACVLLAQEQVIAGVLLHGFPRELEANAISLANECRSRSLCFGYSWGLDGSKDNDGTRLTAKEKGEAMGRVLASVPEARLNGLDLEGQYDSDEGPDDDMDEAGAIEMCEALRALAPNALLFDQPWPMPEQHGDVRRTPRAFREGGTFKGFPVDEVARYVQFRARQLYWENWPRKDRYRYVCDWSDREWARVDAALAPAGLLRPHTITLQGYRHDEQPWTAVDAILSRRDRPVVMWCDPFPTASTLRILHACRALVACGFVRGGENHRDGIKRFQIEAKITADGWCGDGVIAALGIA